jgi:hypothetical protein
MVIGASYQEASMMPTTAHPHFAVRSRLHRAVERSVSTIRRLATMPVRGEYVLWIVLALLLAAFVVVLVAVPTGVGRGGR